MNVDILISTIDRGIEKVPAILLPPRSDVNYKVVHQLTHPREKIFPAALRRDDVKIYYLKGRGLSRSRNKAIEVAASDVAIIADDDVTYCDEYIDNVIRVYTKNPDLDVACFKINVPNSQEHYKWYSAEELRIVQTPPHYISSVEITFKVNRLREKEVKFDTRFGLGSGFLKAGEEKIFMHDCIEADLNIRYFPLFITNHPWKSKRNKFSKEIGNVKGAAYFRLHGAKGLKELWLDLRVLRNEKALKKEELLMYLFHLLTGYCFLVYKSKNRKKVQS